jgi:two-component system, NarL family, response regulator NreC
MTAGAKTRVLVCDDHELFRDGVKAILRDEPTIEVMADARDGREAVEMALRLKPDVALMDLEMPGLNGVEVTRRIHQAEPAIRVLMLTMYGEEELVARCLQAGAVGYVLKDVPAAQLVYAIQAVSRGSRYMSPDALKGMVDHYAERPAGLETRYDTLTSREREIVKLLAEGFSVKQVAARLDVSVKTVDVHKTNLMRKLDVHDRAELIKWAIRNKVIRLPVLK